MLQIYNTMNRQKEVFTPIDSSNVRMYVCGMTVYDHCHLGHARVMVTFDIIARWLRKLGYPLTYVRNITDIDDKIVNRAKQENITIYELTQKYIQSMHEDSQALNIISPDFEPKATDYIPHMIAMIQKLIDNGYAYVANNGDVYYDVNKFKYYGQLSGKQLSELKVGARIEIDENKRNPMDFVLWKATNEDERWSSDWSQGRVGWHIECSAMSNALLGETFDIHGGGSDLQFPHHENEIAQSCGAMTKHHEHDNHVKYWIHNSFVTVNKEKMSKSLDNFFTIKEILKLYDGEVIRFFLTRTHYRSPIDYADIHLNDAKVGLTKLYNTLNEVKPIDIDITNVDYKNNVFVQRFYQSMNNDFNTAEAVVVLFDLATEVQKTKDGYLSGILKSLGNIIGLLEKEPNDFLQINYSGLSIKKIEQYIQQRTIARQNKNWQESDNIRNLLKEYGVILKDNPNNTTSYYFE